MSQPVLYERKYDLTNDDGQDLRTQLDIELDDVARCFLETLTNLALIQRDDGQLANKSVGVEQLKAELIAGFNPPEPFQPFRLYEISDSFVTSEGQWYIVNTSFVATDDAQDNAGDITLVYDFAAVRVDTIAAKDAAEAAQTAAELARDQAQTAATSASNDAVQTGQDRQAAANSASSAASSASSASNSANASAASAANAANAETAAEAAQAKAEQWADNPEDVEVEPDQYSARHWAQKAAELGGDPNQFQVTTSTGTQTLAGALDQRVICLDSLSQMLALDTAALVDGQAVAVTKTLRAGVFTWRAGDYSSEVANDPLQGIYASSGNGSAGAFVRQFSGAVERHWFGVEDDAELSSGWTALEGRAETDAKASGAIAVTPDDVAFPKRAVKTWKRPAGIKDGAVAASFTLHPDESERTTQVTGFNNFNEIGSYAGRDSVALFFQNYATPPVSDTSSTVYTATSVTSADFTAVIDEIKEGMIVEVGFPTAPWTAGVITGKTGTDTLVVSEWIVVDGGSTPVSATTPADGSNAAVNVYTGVWGVNGNVRVQDGDNASKAVGFELGLICNKVGTGPGSTIFDALNLGGAEKPGVAYHARGGLLTAFKQSDEAETGFEADGAKVGFISRTSQSGAFVSVDPTGRHFQATVGGARKFTVESNGSVGNLYLNMQVMGSSADVGGEVAVVLLTASSVTATLPGPGPNGQRLIKFKNTSTGSCVVNRSFNGGGPTDFTLASGESVEVVSYGGLWIDI